MRENENQPLKRAIFYILISALFLQAKGQSQSISGVVNSYYKVTQVYASYIQMDMGEDLGSLKPGDKIVLMQMSGVDVFDGTNFEYSNQFYNDFGNTGRYEMLSVKSVNNSAGVKRVEVTVTLDPTKYDVGEKLQIIKIYEADYATVTESVKAKDWDGETGGVIALVIFKKLTLNANIEADYAGFRGADVESNYSYGCNTDDIYYYPTGTTNRAGKKGEGCIRDDWTHHVGPGTVVSGGGGGIGYFAGGGGGSHFGYGGTGGIQKESCTGVSFIFAGGGVQLNENVSFYGNENRVTMGGGGGSSTEDASFSATEGGDGGGIIIILADTIENIGGSNRLQSIGEPVNITAMAGAGGGGAGGAILLDVNVYVNSLTLDVSGGKGGDTGAELTGAGGGGGGGVICFPGTVLSPSISTTVTRGLRGETSSANSDLYGAHGENGGLVDSLELPLNGFLFNSLNGTDTICQGQIPNTITATMPKGGEDLYVYEWYESTDSAIWTIIAGTDSLEYSPPALYQTIWYRRVVTSGDITDVSIPIKIYVWDAIAGNNLAISDTLCYNTSPGTLIGGTITAGGNSDYAYLWQSSLDQTGWTDRTPEIANLPEGDLQQTTYYRRIASSAKVCVDTSNIDTLSVIPLIDNNIFTNTFPDTAICEGLAGGLIRASQPGGGDNNYRYSWLVSDDDVAYNVIGGAVARDHTAGILTDDKYYKRIVLSGSDDVCMDTTAAAYPITVYPALGNNTIESDSSRYCAGDIPEIINGANPTGGDDPNYNYSWWMREPAGTWEQIIGETGLSYTPSTIYEDSVEIRRKVISGLYDACIDESNTLQIDVIPYIINSLVSEDETVCEESLPVVFTEATAQGGAGVYEYLWQITPVGSDTWQPASEDISGNALASYSSPGLNASSQYRRRVVSEICTNFSIPVTITVYPFISDNLISDGDIQFTCFNSPMQVLASEPGGGSGVFTYFWEESLDELVWADAADGNSEQNYTSPPLTDTMFYRRIVHSGETAQCKDTTSAVLIRINTLPTGDIISSIDTVCVEDELTIGYSNLTGTSPWSIEVGETTTLNTATGLTDATGIFSFTVSESADINMLKLTDANSCEADLSANTGLVELLVWENPFVDAGEDDAVCSPQYALAASQSAGTGMWSGTEGEFSSISDPGATVSITNYGQHTYTWTVTDWQCVRFDEVHITFDEEPDQPYAGEDFRLDNKYQATLSADAVDIGTGTWEFIAGTGSFDNDTLHNTTANFDGPNAYVLMWSVVNGVCDAKSDSIHVSINDLEMYTGFTPNGDGINDEFILYLSGDTDAELIIFDKWGSIVYQEKKSNAEEYRWNGELQNGGNPVPEGTYFYVLKQTGKNPEKNYVELRR